MLAFSDGNLIGKMQPAMMPGLKDLIWLSLGIHSRLTGFFDGGLYPHEWFSDRHFGGADLKNLFNNRLIVGMA